MRRQRKKGEYRLIREDNTSPPPRSGDSTQEQPGKLVPIITVTVAIVGVIVAALAWQRPKNNVPTCGPQAGQVAVAVADPFSDTNQNTYVFAPRAGPSLIQMAQVDRDRNNLGEVNGNMSKDRGFSSVVSTQLFARNPNDCALPVSNIRVSAACHAPATGAIALGQAAPHDTPGQMVFVVDKSSEAMVANGSNPSHWKEPFFNGSNVVTIPPHGVKVFDIRAIALHHACTFSFLMTLMDGNRLITQRIGDNGQPFRVSALMLGKLSHPFSRYGEVWVGSASSQLPDRFWSQENPQTWSPPGWGRGSNRRLT